MGIFGRTKKAQKETSQTVLSFVLLSDISLDIDLLAKNLFEDWGIQLAAPAEEADGDLPNLVTEVDNMMVIVSLMPGPVPGGEAVEHAKNNFQWPEAVAVTESHQAHAMVAVMSNQGQPITEVATLQTKLCASCLRLPNAIAINAAGTVFEPEFYVESAKLSIEDERFPIFNHVFFGIYSTDDGKTVSGYTYGLESLGKQDLEIINSPNGPEEVFNLLQAVASYVIMYDVVLKHGETLGFSAEQKLPITESNAVATTGKTLKIGF